MPTLRILLVLMNVKIQIAAIATIAESKRLSFKEGKNVDRYPTPATAIAAFPHQMDIQYPQTTIKPVKSPKPSLE